MGKEKANRNFTEPETQTSEASGEWTEETFSIWNPIEGEELLGYYEGTVEVTPEQGKPFNAHKIRVEKTGAMMQVAGAKLDKPFQDIKVGTLCKIIYNGTTDLKDGRRMHDYRLLVRNK